MFRPGGRLRVGEDEISGLQRKLTTKLAAPGTIQPQQWEVKNKETRTKISFKQKSETFKLISLIVSTMFAFSSSFFSCVLLRLFHV